MGKSRYHPPPTVLEIRGSQSSRTNPPLAQLLIFHVYANEIKYHDIESVSVYETVDVMMLNIAIEISINPPKMWNLTSLFWVLIGLIGF